MKAGSEPLLFSLDDLIRSEDVLQGDIVAHVKKKVPGLNITSIYMQVSNHCLHRRDTKYIEDLT